MRRTAVLLVLAALVVVGCGSAGSTRAGDGVVATWAAGHRLVPGRLRQA